MAPLEESYPAALLPIAETCPGVLDLALRAPAPSIEERWRSAFALGAMPPSAHTLDAYKQAVQLLPNLFAVDVAGAIEDYRGDVLSGLIPAVHRFAFEITGDLEGRVPARGRERLHYKIDCAWHVSPGSDANAGRTIVLQHELARVGDVELLDLDLIFAGIAMATLYETRFLQVGRCYHAPGKAPVYKWSRTLDEAQMDAYWQRITRVFRRRRELVATDLCERCPMRRICPRWMYPSLVGGAGYPAFRALSGQDPLASDEVGAVRRYAKALRDAVDVAEGQLRTLKREGVA